MKHVDFVSGPGSALRVFTSSERLANQLLRREEAGSAAGELAVPRESKDAPIQPDSDSGKRRAMKPATVDASSSGLQVGGSHTVAEALTQQDLMADGSRMDVESEEESESTNPNAQNIRRRIMTENINGGVTNGG